MCVFYNYKDFIKIKITINIKLILRILYLVFLFKLSLFFKNVGIFIQLIIRKIDAEQYISSITNDQNILLL